MMYVFLLAIEKYFIQFFNFATFVFYQIVTNFTTVFILPNSTSFDIIRTFVHTLLTVPDPWVNVGAWPLGKRSIIRLLIKYVHAVKEELRQFPRPLRGISAIHFAFR